MTAGIIFLLTIDPLLDIPSFRYMELGVSSIKNFQALLSLKFCGCFAISLDTGKP
jgi:hypothetical protein